MKINETDPLHKQIKALMYSMALHTLTHRFEPVYFKMAPFQNFEMDYFGTGQEIEIPLQWLNRDGIPALPVVYADGCPIKLYCKDWVVLKVNQEIRVGKATWENMLLNIPVVCGIRYHFVEERDDIFE